MTAQYVLVVGEEKEIYQSSRKAYLTNRSPIPTIQKAAESKDLLHP